MTLALSFTDGGNRTATFAVTGTGGLPVTVYAQQVMGFPPANGWAVQGSRTGDGSVGPVALNEGHYWFSAATSTAWSAPLYGVVTSGLQPILTRLREVVAARLALLALPGISTDRIYQQKFWDDRNLMYPYAAVALFAGGPLQETYVDGTNAKSDWGKPVYVILADRKGDNDPSTSRIENWRERSIRAFDHQRLPGIPEGYQSIVEPGPILDVARDPNDAPIMGTDFSRFIVRLTSREPRGLGT